MPKWPAGSIFSGKQMVHIITLCNTSLDKWIVHIVENVFSSHAGPRDEEQAAALDTIWAVPSDVICM